MTPTKCVFRILLSEVITHRDVANIAQEYEENQTVKEFFTFKMQGAGYNVLAAIKSSLTGEAAKRMEENNARNIFFQDSTDNKRHLAFSGQDIIYTVSENITFDSLKDEIKNHVFPLVLAANCGIWSFSTTASYFLDRISPDNGLLPSTISGATGWKSSTATVKHWGKKEADLYLLQNDFLAETKDDGIHVVIGRTAQRYPQVSPVLAGKEGEYVLGEVFETAYDRARQEITKDLATLRGE